MHIERPSETHASIVPLAPGGKGIALESEKDSASRSDRLMFDPRVASGTVAADALMLHLKGL
jgi:hypothetical protein